ncbi:protein-disulfide reductase DsbD [Limnobacter sp.]|uniref:protein-disulfide reductase DsbD n=1 Tax=Limnobacter sp. TaxID=2003368 RepID=UPI00351729AD
MTLEMMMRDGLRNLIFALAAWLVAGAAMAQDFLPPEEAFQFELQVQDPACKENCLMDVRAKVAPGYYLYRERFGLENSGGLAELAWVELPRGERKFDEFLNQDIEALRGELAFQIRYSLGNQAPHLASAKMISQGCADAGLCYPPMTTPLKFVEGGTLGRLLHGTGLGAFFESKSANGAGNSSAPGMVEGSIALGGGATAAQTGVIDEAAGLAGRLSGQSAWVVLPVFFGLGLLLAFTPCTLPMLPIVSSLVVGQQGQGAAAHSKARPMALALVYVLGMALTYAVLGVLAGLSGSSLVMAMQQPGVLWSFSGVLALLGVALLLGYSLQLPTGIQTWLQNKTGRLKGGQFAPVLVMGMLSALLLGPCVAPPLAGALLYIGQTGNAAIGGAALFLLALGMGLPLVLFAAGAGTLLPKAGAWMHWVSATFGFLLLAVAIWIATPVTPVWLVMALWAVLACAVSAALFHGASHTVGLAERGRVLGKALGLVFAMLAAVYTVGVFSGSGSLLRPLAGLAGQGVVVGAVQPTALAAGKAPFERMPSAQVAGMLATSGQPVMLDFYADWCVSCKEFELFTLTDDSVKNKLQGIRLVQVDVTDNTPEDQALLKRYRLFGPPAMLFFPPRADEEVARVIGFENAAKFSSTLDTVRPRLGLLP